MCFLFHRNSSNRSRLSVIKSGALRHGAFASTRAAMLKYWPSISDGAICNSFHDSPGVSGTDMRQRIPQRKSKKRYLPGRNYNRFSILFSDPFLYTRATCSSVGSAQQYQGSFRYGIAAREGK